MGSEAVREVKKDKLVFLLDVDNTLLDNDRLKDDFVLRSRDLLGEVGANRFWQMYEEVRQEEGYVDYPAAARRLDAETGEASASQLLLDMMESTDFAPYLYPEALSTIRHLESLGTPAILSDGDRVFQPLKIRRSGLEAAVEGRVLITVHKESELPRVFERFPADHYVFVEDKPRILSMLAARGSSRFTTVWVLQGHYALEGQCDPPPDYTVRDIGDLFDFKLDDFVSGRS
jgi:FMN phosphatase YigB (HAD superfamily)